MQRAASSMQTAKAAQRTAFTQAVPKAQTRKATIPAAVKEVFMPALSSTMTGG
jgi:hypothetical protein